MSPGITVSGAEGSLTVGQSATLNCSTNISVSIIEWVYQSSVVDSAVGEPSLLLTIETVSDDLQGQEYTCRAVAEDGGVSTEYTASVVIQVHSRSYIRIICIYKYMYISRISEVCACTCTCIYNSM